MHVEELCVAIDFPKCAKNAYDLLKQLNTARRIKKMCQFYIHINGQHYKNYP